MNRLHIILLLLAPYTAWSQQKLEVGGFTGFANYQGDLAPDDIEFSETKLSLGGFIRYHLNYKFKVRGNAYFGFISGSDFNDKSGNLSSRGWSFSSDILEVSLTGEYHPFGRSRVGDTGIFRRQVSPYISAGIGMVYANPTVSVSNPDDEALFPEQGFSSSTISIPVGGGVRVDLFEFVSLGLEGGWRLTTDDYLDGVKELGKPNRDLYMFVGASLSVFLGSIKPYEFD